MYESSYFRDYIIKTTQTSSSHLTNIIYFFVPDLSRYLKVNGREYNVMIRCIFCNARIIIQLLLYVFMSLQYIHYIQASSIRNDSLVKEHSTNKRIAKVFVLAHLGYQERFIYFLSSNFLFTYNR